MFASIPRLVSITALFCVSLLCVSFAVSQQAASPAVPPSVLEFPVIFQDSIVAGKTPIGTKVQAKLVSATLFKGTVIPRNATFSGEVIESMAKTSTEPSRLSIRFDSARWKQGSADFKFYVTAWVYPSRNDAGQNLQYGPELPASRTWNGQGQYPDSHSADYEPFPGRESGKGTAVPDTPSFSTSNHRVPMVDVESNRGTDGSTVLVRRRSNLKLDKLTTYVLSDGDLLPVPETKPRSR